MSRHPVQRDLSSVGGSSSGQVIRHTGRVICRLGGKKSDFDLGPGVRFWYQHNPVVDGRDTIRLFDNESNGTPVLPYSRVIWIRGDPIAKTALAVLEHALEQVRIGRQVSIPYSRE